MAEIARQWNDAIATLPQPHFLQTRQWAQIKAAVGWKADALAWDAAGRMVAENAGSDDPAAAALVLTRSVRVKGIDSGLKLSYLPKGPLLDWGNETLRRNVLGDLEAFARSRGAFLLKIDPDVLCGTGIPGQGGTDHPLGSEVAAELARMGWNYSSEQIQFKNSVWVDLRPDEEILLAKMKQKTRYNIRLAQRKGVQVRRGGKADYPLLFRMYAETSLRDGFVIRNREYYFDLWGIFQEAEMADMLIAEVNGEAVAALVLIRFGRKATYFNGMSRQAYREWMPNYLLQWEAMRLAKAEGCEIYDLWGAPEVFSEGDPLWGVYRFKEGLGGEVVRTIGAWDLPLRKIPYQFYTRVYPQLMRWMRRKGNQQTRTVVE